MKKRLVLLLIGIYALSMSCASGLSGFKEPTNDQTMLVVGQVIIEDNYYTQETGVYKEGLEVAIVGKTANNKIVGLWTNTDADGYFAIGDLPKGEYALKGVRALIGRGQMVTITNRLRLSSDRYMVSSKPTIIFNAQYFPFEPTGRVISLQHNIFRLDRMSAQTNQVDYRYKFLLKDQELVDGKVLNEGPVEKHFLEKYPDSAWKTALEESAKVMRFRR
ncbi:MAG: hypothetical protein GWP06_00080 [Actinobacteria bacterium]|nr:hypothetical protein [Actinomycetota bacterium]